MDKIKIKISFTNDAQLQKLTIIKTPTLENTITNTGIKNVTTNMNML